MRRMTYFSPVLLLLVLPVRLVWAQDSGDTLTVTALYSSYSQGEYREILTPCDRLEVWNVVPTGTAFTALAQVYDGVEAKRLFVEVKGRYRAYENKAHSAGVFEITEFVRHSTAAADITACEANAPVSPYLVDGQCGSSRNSCVAGDYFDHYEGDTSTHYRWECVGSYGGDNEVCTAPKAP